MAEFIELKVDPDGRLKNAVKDAIAKVGDLTIPLKSITRSWFRSNVAIFKLEGKGKYTDFVGKRDGNGMTAHMRRKEKYAIQRSPYPILKFTGRLESSLTQAGSSDAISSIIGKNALILGTAVPYGIYHQSAAPRSKLPFRPFIFLGAEQTAPTPLHNRRENWIKILTDHVEQVATKAMKT